MTPPEKDSAISRILSGEFHCNLDGVDYIIPNPTREVRYKAQDIYDDAMYEGHFQNWFSKDEIVNVLIANRMWEFDGDAKLAQAHLTLDNFKFELYDATLKLAKQTDMRKKIKLLKDKISGMVKVRHSLDYMTIEGFALMLRSQFILLNTVLDINRKPVDLKDDFITLNSLMFEVSNRQLTGAEIRELARYGAWRFIWDASKENPFGAPHVDWTDEQRSLFNLSMMYDNVYAHPESPPTHIIEDDDMLDGWMIFQRRERERERAEIEANKNKKKPRGAHTGPVDTFVMVKTAEEAKKIREMNDVEAQAVINRRQKVLEEKGTASDVDMPDIQEALSQKAALLTKEHIHGKRK